MNRADLLARVSIFSRMKKEHLQRVAKQARYREYEEGDVIISEGEKDDSLFIVISGQVEAVKGLGEKNERCLATFGPNTYFGEMALIDHLTRSASLIARASTQILSLEHWDLRQEIEKSPAMAMELLQMLSRRVRAANEIVINVLGGILPVCANCKKIREDKDSWTPIEEYISTHSEAQFSHGICPECAKKLYPEFYKDEQS